MLRIKKERMTGTNNKKIHKKTYLSLNNSFSSRYESINKPQKIKNGASIFACLSKKELGGVYVLQGVIVIPAFACFLVSILFFFRVLTIQESLEQSINYTARRLAAASFAQQYEIAENVGISEVTAVSANLLMHYEYSQLMGEEPYKDILLGQLGFVTLESNFSENYVDLQVEYGLESPVEFFGFQGLLLGQRAKARKWTGYDITEGEDETDPYVYITDQGEVYHLSASCTYLEHTVEAVSETQLETLRNGDGETYSICSVCRDEGAGTGIYYVTKYGNRYHSSATCSEIYHEVKRVHLSQVEGRRACTKCGG